MIGMAFYWFFFANNIVWGKGLKARYFSFISIYSISISRLNLIGILFADPFYLQLTYRALNYCKLVDHRCHVLGIRCVVTLDDFPRTSRPLKWPLPNIIMKLLVFPYLFMNGVSRMSNCLSLWARFSISWFFPRYQGFARRSHKHRTCWRN